MISIEYLRNNHEKVKKSLSSKGVIDGLDEIISIDKDYRKILMTVNDLRADRNKTSDEIAEHNELIATAAAYEKTFDDATKLKEANKTSGKAKLKTLGLSDDEIASLLDNK